MKAVRLHAGPELRVEEVPEPEVGAGKVRVAVRAAGVCGTDLHAARGRLPVPALPVIMGHEGAGIVDAVGQGVAGFREGDRVLLLPSETCGTCPACKAGHLGLCPEARIFGMARDGTFAEKIGVLGSMGYTRTELARVVELAASGNLDLSGSITRRYPLERAAEALDDLASHRGDPVRLALLPKETS